MSNPPPASLSTSAPLSLITLPVDITFLLLDWVPVTTLFRLELLCRHFCTILRTSPGFWQRVLRTLYPPGCAPVLYGHETWRDVASHFVSWSRPWLPTHPTQFTPPYVQSTKATKLSPSIAVHYDIIFAMSVDNDSQQKVVDVALHCQTVS